jgi:predicted CXXCH cytochrome family protein
MAGSLFKSKWIFAAGGVVVLGLVLAILSIVTQPVNAGPLPPGQMQPLQAGAPVDNAACLACHSGSGKTMQFANKDTVSISINPATFDTSVHANLTCVTCHSNISGFPHPALSAQDKRDYTLQYKDACKACHVDTSTQMQDSVHAQALAGGNKNSPVCSDCHDPHTQTRLKDDKGVLLPAAREQIPLTCAKCHSTVFNEYAASVHGKGVLQQNNPDVPTCTDCHGVHTISNPTTAAFRNNSIQLCASCHTNPQLMDKYHISTQVLNTYVADFHGTTVTLFARQSPGEMSNKPVCYDCHGIHNIASVQDPKNGLEIKQNLLAACKRCHLDANTNFPDAWLSHYIPSQTHYPLVYYVNLFYQYFIPLVLGGMALFILTDIFRRVRARRKPPQVEISSPEEQPE